MVSGMPGIREREWLRKSGWRCSSVIVCNHITPYLILSTAKSEQASKQTKHTCQRSKLFENLSRENRQVANFICKTLNSKINYELCGSRYGLFCAQESAQLQKFCFQKAVSGPVLHKMGLKRAMLPPQKQVSREQEQGL